MKKRINIKRLLSKRSKSGFTLVEVIISTALLSILVLGVMTFVNPVMNMVGSSQKNARATMLSQTLNTYISGSLKSAMKVAIFTNTTHDAIINGASILKTSLPDTTKGLYDINAYMQQPGNTTRFEVRCIGIRWVDDTVTAGKKKLMLTNEIIDNNFSLSAMQTMSAKNTTPIKIFDDAVYNGLYPIIKLETFTEESSTNNAKGYKITSDIYSDQKCYSSTSQLARDRSKLAFSGTSYVSCSNMTGPANEAHEVASLQSQMGMQAGMNGYVEGSMRYYYPDTYIYYVVPKG